MYRCADWDLRTKKRPQGCTDPIPTGRRWCEMDARQWQRMTFISITKRQMKNNWHIQRFEQELSASNGSLKPLHQQVIITMSIIIILCTLIHEKYQIFKKPAVVQCAAGHWWHGWSRAQCHRQCRHHICQAVKSQGGRWRYSVSGTQNKGGWESSTVRGWFGDWKGKWCSPFNSLK